ncbi:Predicted lactoylglutathione lyase [Paramicrobacterium humi]|uniref:Predicted lactoylglutathione lyase n=1 Tax=Paramicrobacterium humi TaxID=640635 RepID=A0A1H4T1T8_9MICO|nr:VOC family protein [Microbacterium humi]SEC50387.1 Predicted lactoylglutathione lyase [Microbacterium humi]
MSRSVVQINLIVSDLERTRDFFGVLGWELLAMGERAARFSGDDLVVAFHLPSFAQAWNEAYAGATGGSAVIDVGCDSADDVDATFAALVTAGGRARQVPADTFGDRYAIVEDPDGNLIGLKAHLP